MRFSYVLMLFILLTSCISGGDKQEGRATFIKKGVHYTLTAHEDGFIRIKSSLPKAEREDEDFLLNIPTAGEISRDNNGNYVYGGYSVKPTSDGYIFYVNDIEQYRSSFIVYNKEELEETRTYSNINACYGMGQSVKKTNLAGSRLRLTNTPVYGDQTYLYVPFYITDSQDCVYYNASGFDSLKFPRTFEDEITYSSTTGIIDSYYRKSENYRDAVSTFYDISEAKSLLPYWSYGFIQSKYGYKSTEEVKSIVERFKKENIPLSGLVLDLYWFKKMGDLDWDTERFQSPKDLTSYLNSNGVKLITITEPFFTNDSKNYENFKEKSFFAINNKNEPVVWNDWWCFGAKNGSVINPIATGVEEEIGSIYSKMIKSGIDGFWTDLGEPERVPGQALFNGIKERFFHNYFNREWSRIIHDGVKKEFPDKRLFILSRSGYTGSGQYNVSIWTGDVGANFSALKDQIPLGLNAGLSGFSYWGTDVGGFIPEKSAPELMVRWYQFGAFTPVFRAHGTGDREPWTAGEKNTAIIKKSIDNRYMIMPYIYSAAAITYKDGIPMMRPMFMDYPDTPNNFFDKQYMFGDSILVAPVTGEMTFTQSIDVFLPEGSWYDFETYTKYDGGKTVTLKTTIDSIPVFIRDGSIIPIYNKKYKNAVLITPVDKGTTENGYSYTDDGETEKYKSGEYQEIKYTIDETSLSFKSNSNVDVITVLIPAKLASNTDGWTKDGLYSVKTFSVNNIEGSVKLF